MSFPSFRDEELALLDDGTFIRAKQAALPEVMHYQQHFPAGADCSLGKISRGENHRDLPYRILDYPRYFQREDALALRTLFWWENGFTCFWYLAGEPWEHLRSTAIAQRAVLRQHPVWLGINTDPWQYQLGSENYRAASTLDDAELVQHLQQHAFFKLALLLPVRHYAKLPETALSLWDLGVNLFAWQRNGAGQ